MLAHGLDRRLGLSDAVAEDRELVQQAASVHGRRGAIAGIRPDHRQGSLELLAGQRRQAHLQRPQREMPAQTRRVRPRRDPVRFLPDLRGRIERAPKCRSEQDDGERRHDGRSDGKTPHLGSHQSQSNESHEQPCDARQGRQPDGRQQG